MKILVVGAAKSGTTIISKTIQNSLPGAYYHMEPKDTEFFQQNFSGNESSRVVKIIFEHWSGKAEFRKSIIMNELPFKFDRTVLIVRDPRDEMLSRVMYFVYPWLSKNGYEGNEGKVNEWLSFIKKVEQNPMDYSFLEMIGFLNKNFSSSVLKNTNMLRSYRTFCENYKNKVYLLRYEDFVANDYKSLESYLGFDLVFEQNLGKLSRTRRSSNFNNWKQIFKQEDCDFFKSNLGDLMSDQGYDDWKLEPVDILPVENYSEYLERLISDYFLMKKKKSKKPFFSFSFKK